MVSEVYTPRWFPGVTNHWDLEFLFFGKLPAAKLPHPTAWKDMSFVDVRTTSRSEIARAHEDVIESAGLRFGKD